MCPRGDGHSVDNRASDSRAKIDGRLTLTAVIVDRHCWPVSRGRNIAVTMQLHGVHRIAGTVQHQ